MVDDDNPPPREPARGPEAAGSGSSVPESQPWPSWAHAVPVDATIQTNTSDDELARALEEDFERVTHTGVVPIIEQPDRTPIVEEPTVEPELPNHPSEPLAASSDAADGPPVRRSIPTSELAASLAQHSGDESASIDFIAQLEVQLRLREQDANDFRRWQEGKVAEGGPEALAQVEAARASLGDILDAPISVAQEESQPAFEPIALTHTFRTDDVLDSDLLKAPAPMTAPVADIPPPTNHAPPIIQHSGPVLEPEWVVPPPPESPSPLGSPPQPAPKAGFDVGPAEFEGTFPAPELIPELVEPVAPAAPVDPFDFDALIGGHSLVADETPAVFDSETPSEPNPQAVVEAETSDVADADDLLAELRGPFPVTAAGVAMVPEPAAVEVELDPNSPAQMLESALGEGAPAEVKAASPRAFRVEESSTEPTPRDQRVGRASRLFWLWFAANSSVVSVAFGGAVLALGMSLRQAIVATLIGVAVSFLPLGLGTLAGKWSGQPTMIVSRAAFGHLGNIFPAVLAIIVRVFWGAVLLWFLAAGTARILVGAELSGPLTENQVMIIGLAVGFLLALVIAFFGYGLIARVQLVFTIISALLIAGLIVITWPAVNIPAALTVADGPWILVVTGAVLVFSFVGLVWAVSSADLARYQRNAGSGAASMLWSTFGATIPAFVLIAYGAVLAASDPAVATGLIETPLDTIALLIPVWYPVPLIAALAFSLLSGVVVSIYSGGFALQATGLTMRRPAAVVIVGAGVAILAIVIAFTVVDFSLILRDVATTLAVPVAAWAGIFAAEMMIRNKRFSSPALLKRGGIYTDFRWVNFAMLMVASAIGFGLTTASVSWLSWQGYLFNLLGAGGASGTAASDITSSDIGVFVALAIGILTPIVAGIPAIRKQERVTPEPAVAATE